MLWAVLAIVVLIGLVIWSRRRTEVKQIQEPWHGRQMLYRGDKPDGFESWEAAFNRDITDDLRFEIEYADRDGVVTTREIRPLSIHLVRGEPWVYIKAFCGLRREERTFHSDRILSARNLTTGRQIRNLGQYLRGKY